MKKIKLFVSMAMLVYMAAVLVCFSPAQVLANRGATAIKNIPQAKIQPFCKLVYIDHNGHSIRLSTNVCHATLKSFTFVFRTGENLRFNFTTLRAGHFAAHSTDLQVIFSHDVERYDVHMVGDVIISSVKPLSGSFSHLVGVDDKHLTLISGTFGM